MNILFLTLSYSTKKNKSSYEDLVNEFHKNGNNVFVACANEKKNNDKNGIEKRDGIQILRIGTGNITGDVGIIEKGISTVLIDRQMKKGIRRYWPNVKFDLIMYPTPPITITNTIMYLKRKTGAKTYLLLKDIFPQNAVDLGMLRKSGLKKVLYNYFRKKEKKLYALSDHIGCMSPANCKYIIENNREIDLSKVEVCPNCVEKPKEPNWNRANVELKGKYNINKEAVVFLYGGNLGKPQGIKFLIECMEREKDNKKAFFMVVGSGTDYKKIEKYISDSKNQNVLLLNRLPKEEYKILVAQCDVGMVFLDYRFTIPNFPSRLLSYLSVGKPVLVATDPVCDMGVIAEENEFGYWCPSNDVEAFHNAVQKLVSSNRLKMGENGWRFLLNNYICEKAYKQIVSHF